MAGIKQCAGCLEHKLPDDFSKGSGRCKQCKVAMSRAWRLANPERAKQHQIDRRNYSGSKINGYRLKYRYGITLDQHKSMVEGQSGKCAICASEFSATPHVDHCHKSGKVRGMLCDLCNRGLGYFRDDPDRLTSAAAYLERSA